MTIKSGTVVISLAFLAAGCGFLPLQPESMPDDEIKISWEDSGGDQMVVSYRSGKKGTAENVNRSESITPITLSVDTVSSDFSALFKEIDSWMGTPYRYGKHEKKKGTDCSGFTMEIYQNVFGIQLNRSSDGQVANTVKINKEDLQIGDLVFYNIRGQRISHVGLYIGNNKIVHATISKGVIVSDMDEKYYTDRYERCGRVIKTP